MNYKQSRRFTGLFALSVSLITGLRYRADQSLLNAVAGFLFALIAAYLLTDWLSMVHRSNKEVEE